MAQQFCSLYMFYLFFLMTSQGIWNFNFLLQIQEIGSTSLVGGVKRTRITTIIKKQF